MFYARCRIHLLVALLSVFRLAYGASTVTSEGHAEANQTPTVDQALQKVIEYMMKGGYIFKVEAPQRFKVKLKPEDCRTDIEQDNNLAVGFYGYDVWLTETEKGDSGKPENEKKDHEGCTCTEVIALFKKAQALQLDSGWLCVVNAFCNLPHAQAKVDSFLELIRQMVENNEITIQVAQSVFSFGSDMIGRLLGDDPAHARNGWNFRYILKETAKREDQILIVNALACCVAKGWNADVYKKIIGDTLHSNVEAGLKVAVIEHYFENKLTNGFIDESTFPKIANNFMQILRLATDINMDHENNKQFVSFFFERVRKATTWNLKTASDVLKYYCLKKSKPEEIVGELEQLNKAEEEKATTLVSTVSSFLTDTSHAENTLCQ